MKLTKAQKKYIKENYKATSLAALSEKLGVSEKLIGENLKQTGRLEKKLPTREEIPSDITSITTLKKFVRSNIAWVLLLVELCVMVYINSLGGDFISDDIPSFQESLLVRKPSTLFTDFPRQFHIQMAWYIVAFKLFGLSVFPLHVMSVFSHLLAAITAFIFVSLLFNKKVGVLAAVLFVVHPLTTESVAWISGIFYIWSTLVVLWTAIFYILYRKNGNKRYLLTSLLIYFVCLIFVRQPWLIVTPLFIAIIDIFLLDKQVTIKRLGNWALYGLLAVMFFFYMNFLISDRLTFLKASPEFNYDAASPYYMSTSYTISEAMKYYFYPMALTFYHEGDLVRNRIYFITAGFFLVFGIALVKQKKLAFLQAFFLISMLLSLSPIRVAWYMAERYLYFGTIAYTILLALFFIYLERKTKIAKLSIYLTLVLVLAFSVRTIIRNLDWQNQDKLWIATAKVSPYSPKVHNNLGDVFFRAGDYPKALNEFKTAVMLSPKYSSALHNMGSVYLQMNELDLAKQSFLKSLEYDPNLYNSLYKLGYIAVQEGKKDDAANYFKKTLAIVPDYLPAQQALAKLYPVPQN